MAVSRSILFVSAGQTADADTEIKSELAVEGKGIAVFDTAAVAEPA